MPKTPLELYYDTIKKSKNYIKNNCKNKKEDYDDILNDILSLLFYFKIPRIEEKWVEHYNRQLKIKGSELTQLIKIFIAILVNLIDIIQKDMKG